MTNAELVVSYLSAFASGDPDAVVKYVSEDFQNVQVAELGTGCEGKAVYRDRLTAFMCDFENLRYQVDEVIVEKDRAAVTYNMRFNQNGVPFTISGVMVFELRDGLIALRKDYWDGLAYQKQATS